MGKDVAGEQKDGGGTTTQPSAPTEAAPEKK